MLKKIRVHWKGITGLILLFCSIVFAIFNFGMYAIWCLLAGILIIIAYLIDRKRLQTLPKDDPDEKIS